MALKSVDLICTNEDCLQNGRRIEAILDVTSLDAARPGTVVDDICRTCHGQLTVALNAPSVAVARGEHRDSHSPHAHEHKYGSGLVLREQIIQICPRTGDVAINPAAVMRECVAQKKTGGGEIN